MYKGRLFQDPGLDQVFMTDESVLERLVNVSGIKKGETVLEIGAGPGNLTERLAGKCRKLITIEIDERMRPALEHKFRGMKNVRIIWGNALDVLEKGLRFDRMVANPPYAICEPLIRVLFGRDFRAAILTLPWKFVERLAANPEEDHYSRLSMFAQAFFRIETLFRVEKNAWSPRPDTMSFVVRLTPREPAHEREFVLREMALQDDKKLRNALREALVKSEEKTKRTARKSLERVGLPDKLLDKKISGMSLEEIRGVAGKFAGSSRKYRLVCLDVDGTLLDELQYIWPLLHKELHVDKKRVDEHSEKYYSHETSYREWADSDVGLWKEKGVTRTDILDAFGKIKLMRGVRETLSELRKRGYKLAVISGGIDMALYHFMPDADRIFDHIVINSLTFNGKGKLTGVEVPEEFETREMKAGSLRQLAEKEGVSLDECAFIGDSDNDVEVMEAAGFAIGFNPTKNLERFCDVVIKKKDLREILKHF
jgi:16S rRNA (adenine1518-N6/adenine1519-N6)-dimethyltransferase